ncbi:NADH dehydrogenase [ubiquinone] 1 alpha subcomplex subunit [Trifolium repens]|nr:NADH dehydrogenase [ubiquinone] 1 alpha subcomplex subunit [Trifolium repens]
MRIALWQPYSSIKISKNPKVSVFHHFSFEPSAGRSSDHRLRPQASRSDRFFQILSRWKAMAWRGQLSKNIKELRLLMCQSSPASSSARAFVEKNYKELKTLNPKLPILIRECSGVEPQLWARYDLGVEKGIKLEGMTEPQILKALEDLVKAGQS